MTEINLATQKQLVMDLKVELQKTKEEAQLAREAAEVERKALYQLGVEETEVRLAEELSEVCWDYCDVTWDKALTVAGVPADSVWRMPENVYYHPQIREIPTSSSPPAPAPESSEQPLAIPNAPLFLKSQRDPARRVTKARQLKGRRARVKTRGKSPLPRPKMQPRRRKHRLRLTKLTPRPRMVLLLSQAKRKIPLLRLSP